MYRALFILIFIWVTSQSASAAVNLTPEPAVDAALKNTSNNTLNGKSSYEIIHANFYIHRISV